MNGQPREKHPITGKISTKRVSVFHAIVHTDIRKRKKMSMHGREMAQIMQENKRICGFQRLTVKFLLLYL